jgi:fumarate reductase flavoprotein subunit
VAVDRYNADLTAGQDRDFGRPVKYRDNPGGGLIATPPFYGYPTRPGLTTTYAGTTVDAGMKVRDVFGAGIEGLYAAGETVGGFHGAGYYSGTGLGKAAVFGRIAGREARP